MCILNIKIIIRFYNLYDVVTCEDVVFFFSLSFKFLVKIDFKILRSRWKYFPAKKSLPENNKSISFKFFFLKQDNNLKGS